MLFHKKSLILCCLSLFLIIPNLVFALQYTDIKKPAVLKNIVDVLNSHNDTNFERVDDDKDQYWRAMIETDFGYSEDVKIQGRILASHAAYFNVFGFIDEQDNFVELLAAPNASEKFQKLTTESIKSIPFVEFDLVFPSSMFHLAIKSNNSRIWTSNPTLNDDGLDHMLTWVNTNDPFHYMVGFEDLHGRNSDWDFNDLVVELKYINDGPAPIPTPEPGTLLLLGVGLSGLYLLKRKARAKS